MDLRLGTMRVTQRARHDVTTRVTQHSTARTTRRVWSLLPGKQSARGLSIERLTLASGALLRQTRLPAHNQLDEVASITSANPPSPPLRIRLRRSPVRVLLLDGEVTDALQRDVIGVVDVGLVVDDDRGRGERDCVIIASRRHRPCAVISQCCF